MIRVRSTENVFEWYMLEDKPQCLSCGLYVVTFHGTGEAVVDGETRILCRACARAASHREYATVEALRADTGGEARGRAVEDAVAEERRKRAQEFRSERAKKGARTKSEKTKDRSGRGDEGSGERPRGKPRVRRPKNTGSPKVRNPKRRDVSGVDVP